MHERRFHADIARLRSPERLARLEVNRVVELITKDTNIRRVLDVGTGNGVFAEAFAHAGLDVKRLDANPEMLAAALLLESRIGEKFDAIVTGAASKGTWVRLLNIPVEGKLVQGFENMDVGQRLNVQLTFVDVERGFIDFKKDGKPGGG
jgi:SAM-dependent methyltransferase